MSRTTRRARAVDRPVEQRQHLVDLAEIEMIEREVPPVVHGEEAVARPVVGVAAHPGDAVAAGGPASPCTCATACCAQASRGSSSTAAAAARLGVAHSRRSPRGRRRACRAPRDSPASPGDHAGSARAMRSRSMRASPRKKSSWWPTCSASRSRGYSIVDVLQHPRGRVPAAVDQMADGGEMAAAPASVAGSRMAASSAARATGIAGRLGAEQVQPRLQRVRHDEARGSRRSPRRRSRPGRRRRGSAGAAPSS